VGTFCQRVGDLRDKKVLRQNEVIEATLTFLLHALCLLPSRWEVVMLKPALCSSSSSYRVIGDKRRDPPARRGGRGLSV
jgi:hypothetical protein